jgi:hypothetical protein
MLPGVRLRTMRLPRTFLRSYVDDSSMNDLPFFEA